MQGLWFDQPADALIPSDPCGLTAGVIGAGCCGGHIIKLLRNFEMEILLYDPYKNEEDCRRMGVKKSGLPELMQNSDVITLHAPNIPQTKGMISRELIKKIKDGALFVNTAPGAEVDEEALIEELKTGRFYACIDQTVIQPAPADHPFRDMKNVMLTPHIAGHVSNGFKRQGRHIVDDLERFYKGEKLSYRLNMDRLDIIE
jgi:phosphoglycerate dehydrogenase-like enzyme